MIHLPDIAGVELLPSSQEMRSFDQSTIRSGTSSAQLMERAGSAIALRLKALFPDRKQRILFLCGAGNNGGDGFVAGVKLHRAGYKGISAVLVEAERYSEDLERERERYLAQGMDLYLFSSSTQKNQGDFPCIAEQGLADLIVPDTLIVDALLGTGQNSAPRSEVAEILEVVNRKCAAMPPGDTARISIDLPTGMDADSGAVFEPHFKPDCTINIERIKRGCLQYPARSITGDIFVESIGIDCSGDCEFVLASARNLPLPPERALDIHKRMAGKVFVVGGSAEMPGAPLLSAHSALRTGAGLVVVTQLEIPLLPYLVPELMLKKLAGESKYLRFSHLEILLDDIMNSDCLVLGPGLGMAESTGELVSALIEAASAEMKALVIDADALNHIAAKEGALEALDLSRAILTPHPGEAARLLSCSTEEVQADRYAAARELFVRSGAAAVILKGASSIIYGEQGGVVNLSGNPYMATAGSGDVLSGIVASLLGQGMLPLPAAVLGVHIHARAGDLAFKYAGGPILASDIISFIASAYFERDCDCITFS